MANRVPNLHATLPRVGGLAIFVAALTVVSAQAQGTRLLRQPTISADRVAFAYGGDLWVASRDGGNARRLTSTPAVESDPQFSPDGRWIAFTSNRSGVQAVYVVSVEGGDPVRLTWYPEPSLARGWTRDGSRVVYASSRESAPMGYHRLWTVSRDGGPSDRLPAPWATRGSYSPDGTRIVVDRVRRWDEEWRGYRGGQNTPLTLLDLETLEEIAIPNERTTDVQPVWTDDAVYFLSDRDGIMNVWAYDVSSRELEQKTAFTGADVKWLSGGPDVLVFEREGTLHTLHPGTGEIRTLDITATGDFPWAETRWEHVNGDIESAALSATGKRVAFGARGEIFTVPVEHGDARNLTKSSDAADRAPIWSPVGEKIAWFSDAGGDGYGLMIGTQDGLERPRRIGIGESKMAWEPTWSPDGKAIAFVDDDVRVRVVDVEKETIRTIDTGGTNMERGEMGLVWSPDSRWLAYARTGPNDFRRLTLWSVEGEETVALTDPLADAFAPAWDRDGRHLYFLASTDRALASGWANTSSMEREPEFGAYVVVLRKDDPSPFSLRSDEEANGANAEQDGSQGSNREQQEDAVEEAEAASEVRVDLEGIDRRIIALPMPVRPYRHLIGGPGGTVFVGESIAGSEDINLLKFSLEARKAEDFARGVRQASVSADGEKILLKTPAGWQIADTARKPDEGQGRLNFTLRMRLDRRAEWRQIFDEAWRYERDFFYDPHLHGRDWEQVRERYAPLVPYIRHRNDLTYVLDQVNGELSVGHSFVGGGDFPAVDTVRVGVLGADLTAENGRWRIRRIYTAESWNPELTGPLDRPGLHIAEGDYLVAVNGVELHAGDDPYRLLDGTAGQQTVLHVHTIPSLEGARKEIVQPIGSETALRLRAWVEDNRRKVDELSEGRVAYIWVPNTAEPGVISFNRYFFAQQDKQGAVIDERFNGGGLLDDYMVDLMTRRLRAAITNEVPNGAPFRLPAGILGPKVLLINEMAGSGGDFFPWVFRRQQAGPLIGTRTWGGLVKSSVHYELVDGGFLTAPDNAVFDPIDDRWIGENEGIAPDIEVKMDARSVAAGRDPQLERAVQEALRLLEAEGPPEVVPPPFSTPAAGSERSER